MKWFVAERQPRGLACIVPWEGMADLYRDATRHGGITNTKVSTARVSDTFSDAAQTARKETWQKNNCRRIETTFRSWYAKISSLMMNCTKGVSLATYPRLLFLFSVLVTE
jgi:predicted acyl esterase